MTNSISFVDKEGQGRRELGSVFFLLFSVEERKAKEQKSILTTRRHRHTII